MKRVTESVSEIHYVRTVGIAFLCASHKILRIGAFSSLYSKLVYFKLESFIVTLALPRIPRSCKGSFM